MANIKEVEILNFPFSGQQLIEASAGTGKTWTIAALYIRLILGHKLDLDLKLFPDEILLPENILVVTFTEAATSELKSRIQKRLLETADYFLQVDNTESEKNSVSEDIFLKELVSFYKTKEQRQNCAKLLRLASQNIDNAAIYTIHSWCKKILDEYNLYSSGLGEVKILDDGNNIQQLFNIIYSYWRNYYVNLDKYSLEFIFRNIWKNPVDLYGKLKHLLDIIQISDEFFENEILDENFLLEINKHNDYQILREKFKVLTDNSKNFNNLLDKLNTIFKNIEYSYYEKYFDKSNLELLGVSKENANNIGLIEKLRVYFQQGEYDEIIAKLQELTPTELLKGCPDEKEISHKLSCIDDLLNTCEKISCKKKYKTDLIEFIIKHAAYTIRKWIKQSKQLNGNLNISFDDLLIYCQNICQDNPDLVNILRQKYPVALIDEFQDTDPVQCQIFSTIYSNYYAENQTALILIGDPKQAIYSFRGADIFAYLKTKQKISTQNHFTLKNNYRSTPEIIEALNIFFDEKKHKDGTFQFKKDDYNPLEFIQVQAKNTTNINANTDIYPIEICYSTEKLNKKYNFIKQAAENCAYKIYELLTGHNITAADCAILVNNGKEANAIQRQLKKLNIPSAYLSEKRSVFASDEAYQLFLCLSAVINPNVNNICLALATPLLSEQYTQIMDCEDEQTNNFLEQKITIFQQYFSYLQSQGIQATIEKILLDFNCPQRFLHNQQNTENTTISANSVTNENGERVLTNIRHLAELLQIQSKECYGEISLLNFFANCIVAAKSDSSNDTNEFYDNYKNDSNNIIFSPINNSEAVNQQGKSSSIIRLENDSNLVKIITIHKSKGLEYKYVFLPFLCLTNNETNYDLPIVYYDYSNEKKYEFDKKCSWNIDKNVKSIIKANRIKEDIRKLYVALTRAKNNLWIFVGNYKSVKNSAIFHLLSPFYYVGNNVNKDENIVKDENFWDKIITNLQSLVNQNNKITLNKTTNKVIKKNSTRNHKNFVENTIQQFKAAEILKTPARKKYWGQTSYSALLGQGYNNNFDEFDIISENENTKNINLDNNTSIEEDSLLYKFKEELLQQNTYAENYYNFYNSNNPNYLKYKNTYDFVKNYIQKGAKVGTFLHSLLEMLANKNFITTDKVFSEINLLQKLQSSGITLFKNVSDINDENYQNFVNWLKIICQTPLLNLNKDFKLPSLEQIAKQQSKQLTIKTETEFILPVNDIFTDKLIEIINEMQFIKHLPESFPRENLKIPKINGLLKGFIDLLICYENKYYVLDYKSNYVGDNFTDYNATNYEKIILSHRYDVQAALYQLALHRLLKSRLAKYSPQQHLGGTLFYFLRGVNSFSLSNSDDNNNVNSGVYYIPPNSESIIKMDKLFAK